MLIIVSADDLQNYKIRYGKWNSDRFKAMIRPLEAQLTDEQNFKLREARRTFEATFPEPQFFDADNHRTFKPQI